MPSTSLILSPKQVADALQVSESSVKRWCDQGTIPAERTAGGHRRISMGDLLRYLQQSGRAVRNPGAIGLTSPPHRVLLPRSQPGSPVQEDFRSALAAGDETRCREILRATLAQMESVTEATELLITDAMHRFGEAWERSELDVYQERRACDICLRLIFELRSRFTVRGGPVAIGCGAADDPYQLPTALAELAMREAGWAAESLGANIPFSSLRQAIDAYQPRLVWLSISTVSHEGRFVDDFNTLADSLAANCVLLVGGRALTDQLRPRLHYTAHCDTLQQSVALADVIRRRFVADSGASASEFQPPSP